MNYILFKNLAAQRHNKASLRYICVKVTNLFGICDPLPKSLEYFVKKQDKFSLRADLLTVLQHGSAHSHNDVQQQ